MMRPTLEELAIKYNSDKHFFHSYIAGFYENAFAPMRGTATAVLEIGVGYRHLMEPLVPEYTHGSSLYMWRDYFPNAEIYSCDIRPETLINEGRIHSIVADQSSLDDLYKLLALNNGHFDVGIDDGSHVTSHQVFTARILAGHCDLYVIEDVSEPDRVAEELAEWNPVIHRFPKRNDDCLVVIRK